MKILVVAASLHGGGAEYVARTWMAWLAREGHEVSAVLTGRDVDAVYAPAGVSVESLSRHRGQAAKVRAMRALLEERSVDVALSLQMHPNLTLLSAARLLPSAERPRVIVSERNLVSLGLAGASLRHRAKVRIAQRSYRFADAVIAISHPVAAELVAGFGIPAGRIYVVPNPATSKVDARARVVRPMPEQDLRDVTLLLPCRLVAQKRPHLALTTAAELAARGVAARVVSFGDGPLRDALIAQAADLGVPFEHRGWVENWFEIEDAHPVVLLPSAREGFGNVLVEAAAAGLPSVAISGALGVADAIAPGVSGELALTDSAADLADSVLAAATLDLSHAAGWLRRFSAQESGRLLERVLNRVLGEHA